MSQTALLPATTGRVSLAELTEALLETVKQQEAPAQLGPLLWGLKARKLTLQDFCHAVRVTLGQGVLMSAIGKVAQKKASQRMRSLWRRALAFAIMSTAWLELHVLVLGKREDVEVHLLPSKDIFAHEVHLPRSDSDSIPTASGGSMLDCAEVIVRPRLGIVRPRHFSDALTPPRSKRRSFEVTFEVTFEAPKLQLKPCPNFRATSRCLGKVNVMQKSDTTAAMRPASGNEGMEALASAALAASMVVDHKVDDALSDEDV